jgi:hypothetical protein
MVTRSTAAGGLAIALGLTLWLGIRQPTTGCGPSASAHEIEPATIVVRPWLGPHHVYGVFVVPNQFRDGRYAVTLAVRDFREPVIRNSKRDKPYVDPALSTPGHYLERAYVPTRVALRFFVSGRFGDLRTACQWRLSFRDRQ